ICSHIAKSIYVFLLVSLLTAPFAFASTSVMEEWSHVDDHPGFCGRLSGGFHGECMSWRIAECDSVCKNVDQQVFGECDGLQCFCFRSC
ncbi:hypothetical protein SUGI_0954030, partial [Cryptomeria japonica]